MYARHRVVSFYNRLERTGEIAWKVFQLLAIGYVLYMAVSMVVFGLSR